jgi:hypothetical protein
MQSPDHPQLQFVQAKGYTRGRPDGPPLWVVVHDMEATETPNRAEATAAYFANPGDGRNVSSHYTADNNSVVQCVLLRDVAWTVGNRPGNNRGINWELSGFAAQSRAQWLDEFGVAMFAQVVPIMLADMATYGIPALRCTIDDLKARRKGVTSHNDLRVAFGGTTHTDPGSNFPWDYFMGLLNGADMSEWHVPRPDLPGFHESQITQGPPDIAGQQRDTVLAWAYFQAIKANENAAAALAELGRQAAKLDQILALLQDGGGSGVTLDQVRAQIAGSSIVPPDA